MNKLYFIISIVRSRYFGLKFVILDGCKDVTFFSPLVPGWELRLIEDQDGNVWRDMQEQNDILVEDDNPSLMVDAMTRAHWFDAIAFADVRPTIKRI